MKAVLLHVTKFYNVFMLSLLSVQISSCLMSKIKMYLMCQY